MCMWDEQPEALPTCRGERRSEGQLMLFEVFSDIGMLGQAVGRLPSSARGSARLSRAVATAAVTGAVGGTVASSSGQYGFQW